MNIVRQITACAVVVASCIGVTTAQIPSVLRRMGLNGPVRTIHLELNEYHWEDPGWDPRGDTLHDVIRYDSNGRCLTPHIDPNSGWRAYGLPLPPATASASRRYEVFRKRDGKKTWKTVWYFDKEGRLARWEAYALDEDRASLSNWHHYTYDSQGRVAEMTYWANWGWSPEQTEPYSPVRVKYWFDDAGRIGGWTEGGNRNSRSSLTYDKQGRLVKQVEETEDYVAMDTFDGYDEHGNWTVHTNTQMVRTEDGDEPQSKSVVRRSITYRSASKKRGM